MTSKEFSQEMIREAKKEQIKALLATDIDEIHRHTLQAERNMVIAERFRKMTGTIECAYIKTEKANPCELVSLPKYKAEEKRGLTRLELNAISLADLDAEERLFISLLYYCGLRRGEALALGRGDIDLKRGVLTVNHSLAFSGNKGYLKEPKTQSSCREIPLPAKLKSLLQSYDYDLYLFMRNGTFFTHSIYVKMWKRIIRKLNEALGDGSIDRIQGLTAHIFRHNYASLLHKQGVDVKTAQKLLGHSTSKVTMDTYTHLDELDAGTITAIENAFAIRIA